MDKVKDFNAWAPAYDQAVQEHPDHFPFAGYGEVLAAVVRIAGAGGAVRILELGIGTGNLSARLLQADPRRELWAVDFSPAMLAAAARKVPGVRLLQADLQKGLLRLQLPRCDAVVATYTLHELTTRAKLKLLHHLLDERLVPGGAVLVGDIAFPTMARLRAVRRAEAAYWDAREHYFVADAFLARAGEEGIAGSFQPITHCGGVFRFTAAG